MAVAGQDGAEGTAPPSQDAPRLAEGVQLAGEYEGSGFKEPPSLVRRPDGQVIQLSPLLYLVGEHADGSRDYRTIGEQVRHQIHRQVSADNVKLLVEEKLRPLGVLAAAAVNPEGASRVVASVFRPLFLPPVIVAAVVGVGALDWWLFFDHGIAQSVRDTLYQPGMILLVFATAVASAAFHEIGHAATCSYGGGEPGKMGCGLYLAWPAFYTDVTDAYRLGRIARLRTDLGGGYFNAIVILATAGIYALTGFEPIRKGERGTFFEGVTAVRSPPGGRGPLASNRRAGERGDLERVPATTFGSGGSTPARRTTTNPPATRATTTTSRPTTSTTRATTQTGAQ